jgi:hypothetical protein
MQSTTHSQHFLSLRKFFGFLAIFSILSLSGCGDAKYDSRDPDSLTQMTRGMSAKDEVQFLKDFQLVAFLHDGRPGVYGDGSYVLNGLTAEDIRKEARLAPGYINEKNSKFIAKVLANMDEQGVDETCIYQNEFGFLMPPREDVRPQHSCKTFSREDLNVMLKDASSGSQNSGFDLRSPKQIAEDAAQKSSKLMGDEIDSNPNATPRSEEELKNKERKKKWQDENGFMHYPDGSVSASPVD